MTNKTTTKSTKVEQKNKNKLTHEQRMERARFFSTLGGVAGGAAGALVGLPPLGAAVGSLAGGVGGYFIGDGDYKMIGPMPRYNAVVNARQLPKFATSKMTNVICHREYLGDITGTTNFTNTVFPINPGQAKTFPWLSTIAQNYQEYKIHGLIFEFRSMITDYVTNGAPGTIVMGTNYNADASPFGTKAEMENTEYSASAKPTLNLLHAIECADKLNVLGNRYVRTGSLPSGQDLKFTDLGNFQVATQANPNQNLGELWVTYCVEFFKPITPEDVGGLVQASTITRNTGISSATPLGLIQASNYGTLGVTTSGTNITWNTQVGNAYIVTVFWDGPAVSYTATPSISFSNLAYAPGTNPTLYSAPSTGVTTSAVMFQLTLVATGSGSTNTSSVAFAGGTGLPSTQLWIHVTETSSQQFA